MPVNKISLSEEGPEFSRIISGMWRLDEWHLRGQQLLAFIENCIDLGITTFDHADIYGEFRCEKHFGEAISLNPSIRSKIQIVTKCGIANCYPQLCKGAIKHYNTSTEYIITSVNNSLRNFNTEYVDLLLIHRPDPLMNPDEIAEAFNFLRQAGSVRHFGVSNFNVSQFELVQSSLDFPLVTNQVEFSLLCTEPVYDGVFDYCQQNGIKPMAWSPLARGSLFSQNCEKSKRIAEKLDSVADKYQCSQDQVALAWIMKHPAGILPVIGTGNFERVKSAAGACDIELSREDWFELLKASLCRDVP